MLVNAAPMPTAEFNWPQKEVRWRPMWGPPTPDGRGRQSETDCCFFSENAKIYGGVIKVLDLSPNNKRTMETEKQWAPPSSNFSTPHY